MIYLISSILQLIRNILVILTFFVTLSLLIGSVLYNSSNTTLRNFPIKYIIRSICIGGLFILIPLSYCLVNPDTWIVLAYMAPVVLITTFLRMQRIIELPKVGRIELKFLTLLDLLIGALCLYLFDSLNRALITLNGLFLIENVLGLPCLCILFFGYGLFIINQFRPGRIAVAEWKMLYQGFPEGSIRPPLRLFKGLSQGNTILADIFDWILIIATSGTAFLMGYRIATNKEVVDVYHMVVLAVMAPLFIVKAYNRVERGPLRTLVISLMASGMTIMLFHLMRLTIAKERLLFPGVTYRTGVALTFVVPISIVVIELLSWVKMQAKRIVKLISKEWLWKKVSRVAVAARVAILEGSGGRELKALIVAGIFLVYFVGPMLSPVLNSCGIETLFGRKTEEVLHSFGEVAKSWAVPSPGDTKSLWKFIFGNQGLVLMTIVWCLGAAVFSQAEMNDRIRSIPLSITGRNHKVGLFLLSMIFIILILPFVFIGALFIPLLGVKILGEPVSILLGIFTFSYVIPRIIIFICVLEYFFFLSAAVNPQRDTIDLNRSSWKDIVCLPGIGQTLAKRIENGKPYLRKEDLLRVAGLGKDKYEKIVWLVRI